MSTNDDLVTQRLVNPPSESVNCEGKLSRPLITIREVSSCSNDLNNSKINQHRNLNDQQSVNGNKNNKNAPTNNYLYRSTLPILPIESPCYRGSTSSSTVIGPNYQPNGHLSTGSTKYERFSPVGPVRVYPERIRKRIVLKSGAINLSQEKVTSRNKRYLQDTLTTMVDLRWRYNLLVFVGGYMFNWFTFALCWYGLAFIHGDIDRPSGDDQCIVGISTFLSAFYFSFESQATLGFGNRYPRDDCLDGVLLLLVQAMIGAMIQCFVVGFVFAKLSRPNKRSSTLMFSRDAVISRRDGKLCLFFRVGDIRNRSYIIDASVSAIYISKKITKEGEILPYYHESLKVRFESCGAKIFLMWPATIIHDIDATSPFYWMTPDQLSKAKFEIVLMLTGVIESTGQTIETRTSYLPSEIFWGRRFCQVIDYRMDSGQYRVDYSKFDSTYEVNTPNYSALQLSRLRSSLSSFSGGQLANDDRPRKSNNDDDDDDQVFL
ncbi:G protein-activated inward rectifier potassium channel 3-like [Panonychus citri]|uniref:G protein-activated inward rectifier potassium channel 3-like n=1 Tax=Panonychus citri TaxID=50023 RepID=UPI0023080FAD|nr:G protein-activated inward rectifier potassium channel 3-like [Panonychus citri]